MNEPEPGSVVLIGPPHTRVAWQRSYSASRPGWVQAFSGDGTPVPWPMLQRMYPDSDIQVIYDTWPLCHSCKAAPGD